MTLRTKFLNHFSVEFYKVKFVISFQDIEENCKSTYKIRLQILTIYIIETIYSIEKVLGAIFN